MYRLRKKGKLIVGAFILMCTFTQCLNAPTEKDLYGLWLGVHIEFDPNYPFVVFNEYRPDGTMTAKQLGEKAKVRNWQLHHHTLTVDSIHLKLIDVTEDTFTNENNNYRYLLRRVLDAPIQEDEGQLRSLLQNTSWVSDKRKLHFDREKIYTESEKGLTEIRCWNIEKYNNYAFLYQTGYWVDCRERKGRVMQIVDITEDKLHLSVWNERDKYNVIYTKSEETANFDNLLINRPFQLCSPSQTLRTGNIGNMHKGGGNAIENHFYDNYTVTKSIENETGYLILKFVINCEGEIGQFELIGIDKKYQPYQFHTDLTDQILQLAQSLDEWTPYEYKDKNYDIQRNINFRITNGRIKIIL